jgi:hypothetical protein
MGCHHSDTRLPGPGRFRQQYPSWQASPIRHSTKNHADIELTATDADGSPMSDLYLEPGALRVINPVTGVPGWPRKTRAEHQSAHRARH